MSAVDALFLPAWFPPDPALRSSVRHAADTLVACFSAGGQLLLCGNGGSAADCDHVAGELLKSFRSPRPLTADDRRRLAHLSADGRPVPVDRLERGLPAISLPALHAASTAIANDIDPAMVFAQLTVALGRPGDVLFAISTSGASRNVVNAAAVARRLGLVVVAVTGAAGGPLATVADLVLAVPATDTARVQELHLAAYHAICDAVESELFR